MNGLKEKYNSRKFVGLLWGWFILMSLYQSSIALPEMNELFSSLVNGIIALYFIYCGGNVASTFVTTKKTSLAEQLPNAEASTCEACGSILPK